MTRWAPAIVLASTLGLAWTVFLSGGLTGAFARQVLASAGPLIGLVVVIVAIRRATTARRLTRPLLAVAALGIVALWPLTWRLAPFAPTFPASMENHVPVATVRLPADGPLRVVWGGDRVASNYHATTRAQRWAYDFAIDPVLTGSRRLEDYGCYGTPVLAPVSARVHDAFDGAPDHTPGSLSRNRERPVGNGVVFALDTGTFLVIAHLKQGSVRVRAGQFVEEGTPIGLCGNSGNTSEPHIHIHHQRDDPADGTFYAEGLPLFFRGHDGSPMPEGGIRLRGLQPVATGAVVRHRPPVMTAGASAAWNAPQQPLRIHGRTYFVGTHGLSALLIAGEAGHVLIDAALPESAPQIIAHVRELGFRAEDIKAILTSHVHFDHAGGVAELQRVSGAQVFASPWSAAVLQSGTVPPDDPQSGVIVPIAPVPAVSVLSDGEAVSAGGIEVTARFTPGHTPGGTSWTWESCEQGSCRTLAYVDSLTAVAADGFRFTDGAYRTAVADFERTFEVVGGLPCDILITPHPAASDLWRRIEQKQLVETDACRRYADAAGAAFQKRLAQERSGR